MRLRTLCLVGAPLALGCLLLAAVSEGQPPPPVPGDPFTNVQPPPPPMAPPPVVTAPAVKNIDEMLNAIAAIRAKKAELEKQEQALVKELRTKLKEQQERLVRIGISPDEAPRVEPKTPEPDRLSPPAFDAPKKARVEPR